MLIEFSKNLFLIGKKPLFDYSIIVLPRAGVR